jgi:UDP-N-acetyl-D-glucosamine dehydrogenase
MTKPLKNTSQQITIALVNKLTRSSRDLNIDLWEVIGAAPTQPYRFQSFRHGPGASGHSIRVDRNYLSHNVRAQLDYPFRRVEPAEEINTSMPAHLARRAQGSAEQGQQGSSRFASLMPTPISCSKRHHV